MKIVNFGSLNIDHVYGVDHFVRPGETIPSESYRMFAGGKGANQSIALGRAGAPVFHAGKLGSDGAWLRELLHSSGVDVSLLELTEGPSGHAIIQVTPQGQNAIILNGGANHEITPDDISRVLKPFGPGDWLLAQNEISSMPHLLRTGKQQGMTVVFNPAPMHPTVLDYPLECVDIFIVNEIEGAELTGTENPSEIIAALCKRYPGTRTVLTLGKNGVRYGDTTQTLSAESPDVKVVDTTAAGDCFIGYFLAELTSGSPVEHALKIACCASAIAVSRPGAAVSIPVRSEVIAFSEAC